MIVLHSEWLRVRHRANARNLSSLQYNRTCSACRAVWYCGTACSHADWREGGHRRMCKALAAARQAAKQQARRGAAEEGQ